MKKIWNMILKCIHPVFIVMMILIIICGCMIVYNNQHSYATETWVHDYISAYNTSLSDLDMQVLTTNLSNQIDKKINEIDFQKNFTEDDLIELMAVVNEELQYANYTMSQDEISKLSAIIVREIISDNLFADTEKYEEYDLTINNLENQITDLRVSMEKINEENKALSYEINQMDTYLLTEEQVRQITEETGMSEETVKKWISELEKTITDNYEAAIQEFAELLDVDAKTLKELTQQAIETENSIEYLSKKLGITEEKLNAALAQIDVSDNKELVKIVNELKASQEELQEQIDGNLVFTTTSLSNVQNQVSINKAATDTQIALNKRESEASLKEHIEQAQADLTDNTTALDEKITELNEITATKKALEDAQISLTELLNSEVEDRQVALQTVVDDLNEAIVLAGDQASNDLKTAKEALEELLSQEAATRDEEIDIVAANAQLALDNSITEVDSEIESINTEVSTLKNTITLIKSDISNMNTTLQEAFDTIESNKEEVEKQISDNKTYTDNAIEELQTNVLLYEYDESSNTLKLFEKTKEGEAANEN